MEEVKNNRNNLFEIRIKLKGGSQIKCAFININGAPHEFKNLHKTVAYKYMIAKHDIITLTETGTTNKGPDKILTKINAI